MNKMLWVRVSFTNKDKVGEKLLKQDFPNSRPLFNKE